jgi:hypothetical protein
MVEFVGFVCPFVPPLVLEERRQRAADDVGYIGFDSGSDLSPLLLS